MALFGILILAAVGLAFSQERDRASDLVLARSVGLPSDQSTSPARQLVEPGSTADTTEPVALARIDNDGGLPSAEIAPAITELAEQRPGATAETITSQSPIVNTESDPFADGSSDVGLGLNDEQATTSTTAERSGVAQSSNRDSRAPGTTTTQADSTTTTNRPASGQSSSTSTSTAQPSTTSTSAPASISAGGWVSRNSTGHRNSNLLAFPSANDGNFGVTIDQDFLDAHQGAPWLSTEGGRPVISRIDASGRCLNIRVTLTLRDSYVNCPTRTQNDSWGYVGEVDDAPAVNLRASDVVVQFNTITCSGSDEDICSRSVRISGEDAVVEFNDLSLARGAVQAFTGTTFRYNYVHDLAFGFDPTRANNPDDNITHNNVVNSLGYRDVLIQGNYIVARYGRVSSAPSTYRNPYTYHGTYENGIVEVGDPINGFTFTNYLVKADGDGLRIIENFVEGAGRPFRCNSSSRHSSSTCAADISRNAFAQDYFDAFGATLFDDKDGNGTIAGSCNSQISSNGTQLIASNAFGNSGTHRTSGC